MEELRKFLELFKTEPKKAFIYLFIVIILSLASYFGFVGCAYKFHADSVQYDNVTREIYINGGDDK